MSLPMVSGADDRRTCRQCLNLQRNGVCGAAEPRRHYAPEPDLLRRCENYRPDGRDADKRPGRVRWPGLLAVRPVVETRRRK